MVNKKILIASVVLLAVGGAGYLLYKRKYLNAESFGDDKEDTLGYSKWFANTPEFGVPIIIEK